MFKILIVIALLAFPTVALSMEDNGSLQVQYQEYLKQQKIVAELQLSDELMAKAVKLKGKHGGQCVVFVRNFLDVPYSEVHGAAKTMAVNSDEPEIGAIGKTNQSRYGHLFVVLKIDGEILTIADSNYGWDTRVRIRQININDPRIVGYKTLGGD